MGLINQNSVGKKSIYGNKIPTCSVGDLNLAEFEMSKCLGEPFMDFLESKIIDYSDSKEWEGSIEFKEGDKVILFGSFWIATKDNVGQEPELTDCWVKGEKFEDDCLNELWCEGSLWSWMDIEIQIKVAPELSMPLGANGWTKRTGKDVEGLSAKEIGVRLQMLKAKAGTAFEMLDRFIKKKCDQEGYEGCFDLYKGLNRDCCSGCGCVKVSCSCSTNCVEEKLSRNDFGFA